MTAPIKVNLNQYPTPQEAHWHATSHKQQRKDKKLHQPKVTQVAQPTLTQNGYTKVPSPELKKSVNVIELDSIETEKTLHNLTLSAQQAYEEQLKKMNHEIGKFVKNFIEQNKRYADSSLKKSEQEKNYYSTQKSEDTQTYQSYKNQYKNIESICLERMNILGEAILLSNYENQFLKELLIGNDSYIKSYNIFKLSLGYKYGINHRLGQSRDELEKIKLELSKLKSEETKKTISHPVLESNEKLKQKIVDLSHKIYHFKEIVTIDNEALNKLNLQIKNSEIPQQLYSYQYQQSQGLKAAIEKITPKKEAYLKQLDEAIEQETTVDSSDKLLACQQEKEEINQRWKSILARKDEIETLLAKRKTNFTLSDQAELKGALHKGIEELSQEANQAIELLFKVTSFKEDIFLGAYWKQMAPVEQRTAIYHQDNEKQQELEKEKNHINIDILQKRHKTLQEASFTYGQYIKTMQQNMQEINHHFENLKPAFEERKKWQVDQVTSLSNQNKTEKELASV